jgi:hypothetical protein
MDGLDLMWRETPSRDGRLLPQVDEAAFVLRFISTSAPSPCGKRLCRINCMMEIGLYLIFSACDELPTADADDLGS